jgi:hypothetical protein
MRPQTIWILFIASCWYFVDVHGECGFCKRNKNIVFKYSACNLESTKDGCLARNNNMCQWEGCAASRRLNNSTQSAEDIVNECASASDIVLLANNPQYQVTTDLPNEYNTYSDCIDNPMPSSTSSNELLCKLDWTDYATFDSFQLECQQGGGTIYVASASFTCQKNEFQVKGGVFNEPLCLVLSETSCATIDSLTYEIENGSIQTLTAQGFTCDDGQTSFKKYSKEDKSSQSNAFMISYSVWSVLILLHVSITI